MIATWVLETMIILAISFIMGFIFYYLMSSLSKKEKKQQVEQVLSMIINFIIYVWLGKVLLNIRLFITDPLAVLAYPSNSHAFYLAMLFTVIHIFYKQRKQSFDMWQFLYTSILVFVSSSFFYEFIQIVWKNDDYTWSYLVLLMVLLVVTVLMNHKLSKEVLTLTIMYGWIIGKFILVLLLPFTTIFGYIISPIFLIFLFVATGWITFRYIQGKRV